MLFCEAIKEVTPTEVFSLFTALLERSIGSGLVDEPHVLLKRAYDCVGQEEIDSFAAYCDEMDGGGYSPVCMS